MAKRRTMKKTMKRSNKLKGGGKKKVVKKTIKKNKSKKSNWMTCLSKARKQLGIKGFVTINKGKEGIELYKLAKKLQGK